MSRHARPLSSRDRAARAGYFACAAVLLGSGILLAVDPGRGVIGVCAGAVAVVCGLACRSYLHKGRQQ